MSDLQLRVFESRYAVEPNTGCWLWLGHLNAAGYGRVVVAGRNIGAHRASYEALVGPAPLGLVIDHLCQQRCCVNPAHLEPVTSRENTRRGRLRHVNGDKTHCTRGHEYAGENLRVAYGRRHCRACARMHDRAYRTKKRGDHVSSR